MTGRRVRLPRRRAGLAFVLAMEPVIDDHEVLALADGS
jgi:hypothetical protein